MKENDKLIYESENFFVNSAGKPHIDRNEGGHIKIVPKKRVLNRQIFIPKLAIELMRLSIVVGEAMTKILNKKNIKIGRINYQDNGNWSVFSPKGSYMHLHLYGRSKDAKIQKYGQSCYFPHKNKNPEFYKNLNPLNDQDILDIKLEIQKIFKQKKFQNSEWKL